MTRQNLGITLNDRIVSQVDAIAEREDMPRSRVIEQMIKERLGIASPLGVAGQGGE
jgi:metal-responsive CopG/Arc/MetJ family transcriptional regulator